jgi:hypothetical protein
MANDEWTAEEVLDGNSCHMVYRMYSHDKEYIPGTNEWIKWDWDGKYELVSESKFLPTFIQ